jgi:hypothetical protein
VSFQHSCYCSPKRAKRPFPLSFLRKRDPWEKRTGFASFPQVGVVVAQGVGVGVAAWIGQLHDRVVRIEQRKAV